MKHEKMGKHNVMEGENRFLGLLDIVLQERTNLAQMDKVHR